MERFFTMNLSDKVKTDLLGSVKRLEADGNHSVNAEKILSPLEKKESIIRLFCTGCGLTYELTRELGEKYLSSVSKTLPSIIEPGEYVESNGCGACTGPGDSFEIKKV
ncbi:MAG TPA: hypothetical protein VMC41_01815 [Candidatus Nanoarchaeia archaeon]|nr:hypothetical protein [Candidatus Nanoarchaeia archaeon]